MPECFPEEFPNPPRNASASPQFAIAAPVSVQIARHLVSKRDNQSVAMRLVSLQFRPVLLV